VRTDGEAQQTSPRLALKPHEAAAALGCSRDFFDMHIGPELRWVRRGRLKFVSIIELEDWLHRSAAMTADRDGDEPHVQLTRQPRRFG
jgi:hypothetical protein